MKRPSLLLLLASLGLVLNVAEQRARAQMPYGQPGLSPYGKPVLSPYLNLARPGNPAINYFGLVAPQNQFAGGLNMLQQQVAANQYGIAALGAQDPLTALYLSLTGHPIAFMNYRRYFLNYAPINPALALGGSAGGYGYGGSGGYGGYGAGYGGGYGAGYGGLGAGYGGLGAGFNPFGSAGGYSPFGTPGGQPTRPGTGTGLPGTGFRPGGIR